MSPIQAQRNFPPAAAVEKFLYPGSWPRTRRARRVGFSDRFGVKLAVLWAEESGLPLLFHSAKYFKSLKN